MKINRLALIGTKEFALSENMPDRTIPDKMLLVKFGKNQFTKDGKQGEFEFSEEDADSIITDFGLRGKDVVIDYEHQTLSGGTAPAAGWISALAKSTEGLVAKIKYWTGQAENYLANGEYRYFSPVLYFSRTGRSVSALHSVAITNHPALHNIPALVADDTSADADSGAHIQNNKITKEKKMKELLEMLGLPALENSSEEEQSEVIASEVKKLLDLKKEVSEFLKLHNCESLDKLTGKIQGMCPASEKAELEKVLRKRDAETAVSKAFSDGKLAEKSKEWAVGFAERDLKAFSEWADAAPVIVPVNEQIGEADAGAFKAQFSEIQKRIFRNLGLNEEQIMKIKESK